jgi:hypothetical protein
MPRIISMPWESMMMRFDKKSTPTYGNTNCQTYMLIIHSPPGELTIMVYFMMVMGRLCFATDVDALKECDAPE